MFATEPFASKKNQNKNTNNSNTKEKVQRKNGFIEKYISSLSDTQIIIILAVIIFVGFRAYNYFINNDNKIIVTELTTQVIEYPADTIKKKKSVANSSNLLKSSLSPLVLDKNKTDKKTIDSNRFKVNTHKKVKQNESNISALKKESINRTGSNKESHKENNVSSLNSSDKNLYRKQLLSILDPETITFDLFGDKPIVSINGIPYLKRDFIGKEFRIGDIRVKRGGNTLEDVILSVTITKTKKNVITVNKKVGELCNIKYFEGGIDIFSKKNNTHTGIMLDGERLTPFFSIITSTITNNHQVFKLKLLGGKVIEVYVPLDKVI